MNEIEWKTGLRRLLGGLAVFTVAALASGMAAAAGIADTKHNLGSTGTILLNGNK